MLRANKDSYQRTGVLVKRAGGGQRRKKEGGKESSPGKIHHKYLDRGRVWKTGNFIGDHLLPVKKELKTEASAQKENK